jgi:hypothetical protein
MFKVTIKFAFISVILFQWGCHSGNNTRLSDEAANRKHDSLAERRIDSAYAAIRASCDTDLVRIVPMLVDSLQKGDSTFVSAYLNSRISFTDSDKKVERVVRQLQVDCSANLLKETYKRAQTLQRSSKQRHRQRGF